MAIIKYTSLNYLTHQLLEVKRTTQEFKTFIMIFVSVLENQPIQTLHSTWENLKTSDSPGYACTLWIQASLYFWE